MKYLAILVLLSFLCMKAQAQKTDSIVANDYTYQQALELFQFPELRYLKLSSYKDSVLPDLFDQLPNLEHLEIDYAAINRIPLSIGSLSKLKKLTIANGRNHITIPSELGKLTELRELNLYNYTFESIPASLGNLVHLEKAMLCGELTGLPATVSNWKKLKILYLAGNKFSEIPAPIFQLTQLKSLDVSRNEISQLNDSIGFLNQLNQLSLNGNIELEELPPHFCELEKLEKLFIQNTKIPALPACLNELPALKRIVICKTVIDDPAAMEAIFNEKIDWDRFCQGLESHLINFSEVYGTYHLKMEHKKDTVILHYGYFYNQPGTIDEEFTRNITIKLLEKDRLKLNHIYKASNPHFLFSYDHFSVWDWDNAPSKQQISGYLQFMKISKREYQVYLNLDLIENGEKRKLVDQFLTFHK